MMVEGGQNVQGERSPCSLMGGCSSSWPTGAGQSDFDNSLVSNKSTGEQRGGEAHTKKTEREQQMGFYCVKPNQSRWETRWRWSSETLAGGGGGLFNVRWNWARQRNGGDERKGSFIASGGRRHSLCGDDIHVVSGNVVHYASCHEER